MLKFYVFKGFLFFYMSLLQGIYFLRNTGLNRFQLRCFQQLLKLFYLNSSPTIGPFQEASSNIDLICKDCHIQSSISTSYL